MMKYNPEIHNRKSIRLKGYDYSQPGAYYVTICVGGRECVFGHVGVQNFEPRVCLSELGKIADDCWQEIPEHFPNVRLDEYIIMPNHVHGILCIADENDNFVVGVQNIVIGVQNFEPLQQKRNEYQKIIPRSLGSIIRGFKIGVTNWYNLHNHGHFQWQRNFHDRIIRDKYELDQKRKYIQNNPKNWHNDEHNPKT